MICPVINVCGSVAAHFVPRPVVCRMVQWTQSVE
jgi:hypothetical protein